MDATDTATPWATIPDHELRDRRRALSERLAAAGIDCWVAYGDDRAVAGADHIRYLTDLEPHFEPVLLVGCGERALLIVGPETEGYARVVTARAGIEELVISELLGHASEEYPALDLGDGLSAIRDFLADARRVGLLAWDRVGHPLARRLAPVLAEGREAPVEADGHAYELRSVKTAAEQAVIDRAYEIARAGIEAAARAIAVGTREREVAAEAEAAMRRAGAEGFGIDTMVASGVANTRPILARSTFRAIAADDLVTVTVAPRYEGYHAAIARPFLLRPNAELERCVGVARDAQRAAAELLRPGRLGWDAERASRATVAAGDTGAEFPYVGIHSIGVVEFEPPIFASDSPTVVADGMALSIDVPLFHAAWGGFRIEDGFAIGESARPRIADYDQLVPLIL